MACATLKRHLDWDPMSGLAGSPRSAKRRRCIPFHHQTPASSPTRQSQTHPEFLDAAPKLNNELIANSVCNEVRRLQRRKQLPHFNLNSPPSSPEAACSSSQDGTGPSLSSNNNNNVTPLFTFKQVNLICERLLREREEELRQQYDRVLNDKLAEQYNAFVRFTNDHIERRFASQADFSYCS